MLPHTQVILELCVGSSVQISYHSKIQINRCLEDGALGKQSNEYMLQSGDYRDEQRYIWRNVVVQELDIKRFLTQAEERSFLNDHFRSVNNQSELSNVYHYIKVCSLSFEISSIIASIFYLPFLCDYYFKVEHVASHGNYNIQCWAKYVPNMDFFELLNLKSLISTIIVLVHI